MVLEVITEDSHRRMNAKGWDVLWEELHDIVKWWNLELLLIGSKTWS